MKPGLKLCLYYNHYLVKIMVLTSNEMVVELKSKRKNEAKAGEMEIFISNP